MARSHSSFSFFTLYVPLRFRRCYVFLRFPFVGESRRAAVTELLQLSSLFFSFGRLLFLRSVRAPPPFSLTPFSQTANFLSTLLLRTRGFRCGPPLKSTLKRHQLFLLNNTDVPEIHLGLFILCPPQLSFFTPGSPLVLVRVCRPDRVCCVPPLSLNSLR